MESRREHWLPQSWNYVWLWAAWRGSWELNLGPLWEQCAFLMTEPSFQTPIVHIFMLISNMSISHSCPLNFAKTMWVFVCLFVSVGLFICLYLLLPPWWVKMLGFALAVYYSLGESSLSSPFTSTWHVILRTVYGVWGRSSLVGPPCRRHVFLLLSIWHPVALC